MPRIRDRFDRKKGERHGNQWFLAQSRRRSISTNDSDPDSGRDRPSTRMTSLHLAPTRMTSLLSAPTLSFGFGMMFQIPLAAGVGSLLIRAMLDRPVDFNDEVQRKHVNVDLRWRNRMLPPELHVEAPPIPEPSPICPIYTSAPLTRAPFHILNLSFPDRPEGNVSRTG